MRGKPQKNHEILRALAYLSNIGFTMAAAVIVAVFIGRFLDRRLGTDPWFLLIFSLLGVVTALKALFNISKYKFKDIMDISKDDGNNED